MIRTGFYDLSNLDIIELRELFDYAISISSHSIVHKLDCDISWNRKVDEEFTIHEILDKYLSLTSHNTFVDRSIQHPGINEKFELCASTIANGPDYFAYVHLDREEGFRIIEKFNLKE